MTISDIVNSIYIKTKTNSTSYPAADMLIAINNAYERVASLILQADGRWQWDDTNFTTDFPIATTNLVLGQADYTLASTHLRILRVEVADSSGTFSKLEQFDPADKLTDSLTQLATETGTPTTYDIIGASVVLYPKPNYNYTAGLKIYFQRGPSLFTSAEVTTGSKNPGFNSLYHDLIPLWVAYNYALDNSQSTANGYMNEIIRKEESLKDDYSSRNKDQRDILTTKRINFR